MGFYSRHVFPRLCDWAMRAPDITRLRREVLSKVDGEILEIGFGTGLNLKHYPEDVRHLTAVDPGVGMSQIARRRIELSDIDVDLHVQTAEELPFKNGQFDCVVSTWTLCSIRDGRQAVAEIGRVLKPGGRFLFLEHGLSDEGGIQRWQRRLTPLQKRLADGCRLDLDIEALVRSGAFREVQVERFLLESTPRIVGSMYRGVAVR
ncbi:MAG TPA: class I SAM-dependent methyltransferase, partial [Isosphaeraceae bacterium]|nr:class I SAM-dependent methyltransferase [Isosphaeraceae bacterium]